MKVCLLSYSDGGGGGGFSAAYRLHRGLLQLETDSTMIVDIKTTDDFTVLSPKGKLVREWVKLTPSLDVLPILLYSQRDHTPYSIQWLPDRVVPRVSHINPDIINLHWINFGCLQIESLNKFNQPIVWTLHDMWAFTGGCHYSGSCNRYSQSCGSCPQLGSHQTWDLSRWIWKRKAKAWKNLNLTLVTPSQWLADCANNSSLFRNSRIEVIPNGLDVNQYKPFDRNVARELLNLPDIKHLLLFGAASRTSDRRKGFHLLLAALKKLSNNQLHNQIELIVFGSSQPMDPPDLGFKTHYLGKINGDLPLSLVYSAANVFIAPSLEDNLPNTVMEALACGIPSVAFNIGGMSDMIEHKRNGYLAEPYAIEDLANGIAWVLEDKDRYSALSFRARQKVEQEFSLEIQARHYLDLYEELSYSSQARIKQ
jgi:glycosyltransferase involved in cell wall biosynthesis